MAARSGVYFDVDISDLQGKIEMLHNELSEPNFQKLMRRTFNETGRKTRTILKRTIPQDYEARPGWIMSNVGSARVAASGMGCTIPIDGAQGVLGARFKVSGGTGRPVKGKRQIIRAKIVKGKKSELPPTMKRQGNEPPFRAKGIVFTRKGASRLPIVPVVGLGVPQMPLNRSEGKVQTQIQKYIEERLDHNFMIMFGK